MKNLNMKIIFEKLKPVWKDIGVDDDANSK